MTTVLTVQALYDKFHEKLGLEWIAGRLGSGRVIEPAQSEDLSKAALVGYLNFIHPHRIQVLGTRELSYLKGLKQNSRQDAIHQLYSGQSDLLLFAESDSIPNDLKQRAEATSTAVMTSDRSSEKLISTLHYFLASRYAEKKTLHGVFMEVMGIGVLITGDSSIGKSELALELISRGHRLIADDAPEFSPVAPDLLSGTCPPLLQDFLEVRGLGVLNIRAMYGDSVIKSSKYLRLIVYLERMTNEQLSQIDRLRGSHHKRNLLGIEVPEITVPVAPGRNLAVMVEAAAKNHILKLKDYDAGDAFAERQQKFIKNDAS